MVSVVSTGRLSSLARNSHGDKTCLRLALYETSVEGHRGVYLTAIVSEALHRGWAVTVVSPAKDQTHPYFSKLGELLGHANLLFTPGWIDFPERVSPATMLRHHFDQWRTARQSLATGGLRWDFVYAPNIDYMDKAIQMLGVPSHPVPMGGMVMRARFHLRELGVETHRSLVPSLAPWAFSRLLRVRDLVIVTTADPTLAQYCENKRTARYRKVAYIPEIGMTPPTRDSVLAKEELGFARDDKVILIFGAIDKRKAFLELGAALECIEPAERVRLLIVGQPDRVALQTLGSGRLAELRRKGTLVTRLGFADDATQETAFAAADFVVCGEGIMREALASAADQLRNVRLIPLQPFERIGDLLGFADIHLLPQSPRAGDLVLPSKLSGMLASGRPVIATCNPGTELDAVVSKCGVVVPPEDGQALTGAIVRLADNPTLRSELGRKARAYAASHFDRDAVLLQVFGSLASPSCRSAHRPRGVWRLLGVVLASLAAALLLPMTFFTGLLITPTLRALATDGEPSREVGLKRPRAAAIAGRWLSGALFRAHDARRGRNA